MALESQRERRFRARVARQQARAHAARLVALAEGADFDAANAATTDALVRDRRGARARHPSLEEDEEIEEYEY